MPNENNIEIGFASAGDRETNEKSETTRNAKIGRLFNLRKQISKDLNRSIFNLKEIYSTKTEAFVGKAVEIKM